MPLFFSILQQRNLSFGRTIFQSLFHLTKSNAFFFMENLLTESQNFLGQMFKKYVSIRKISPCINSIIFFIIHLTKNELSVFSFFFLPLIIKRENFAKQFFDKFQQQSCRYIYNFKVKEEAMDKVKNVAQIREKYLNKRKEVQYHNKYGRDKSFSNIGKIKRAHSSCLKENLKQIPSEQKILQYILTTRQKKNSFSKASPLKAINDSESKNRINNNGSKTQSLQCIRNVQKIQASIRNILHT